MNFWKQHAPELVTDLYEFTMAASYWREKMFEEATFSLFVRDYPPRRAYFVAAGLEPLLETLLDFRMSSSSLEYLESTGIFPGEFLGYLEDLRFTGTVRAMPEGRIFFADEPLLEIDAPIIQGQLVETLVMNALHLDVLAASKAARCVHAAGGRGIVDFSLRRTQGIDAGMKVARCSYMAGFQGTSNVLAGKVYSIPVFGTMAHSYITSFDHEMDAFSTYARTFPDATVLLIDTYDTLSGAEKAVEIARRLEKQGKKLGGVRLDSGDLADLSRKVRRIFRDAGLEDVKILASGGLDEYKVADLLDAGAEIDLIAIGSKLGVSADAPCLDMAYKLVEYKGRPVLKLSPGKRTWVGKKQVFRFHDKDGKMERDILGLDSEDYAEGKPLLERVVVDGRLQRPLESMEAVRRRFAREWESLPEPLRAIRPSCVYPVDASLALEKLEETVASEKEREEIRS